MKRKLQVFISSTFSDLQEERQAAVSAVLKAGHIPAGMELFTSGDHSQMATIKEWIDESDVYMLILGGRYGSIERNSGISYTELEYDYAQEQSKPSFAVVITENALEMKIRSMGTQFGEKENPKELNLFRQKVLCSISSFFDDHKDIKLCVHESLADFSANRDLKGWVSADEIVDTRPLFDEIKKLSDENKSLKEIISKIEHQQTTTIIDKKHEPTENFQELAHILGDIIVKVPAHLSALSEDKEIDLLMLMHDNKEVLINGITNSINSSEAETFFYYNIFPKLLVHDLAINQKVDGVQYRISRLSAKGRKMVAWMDKKIFKANKKINQDSTAIDHSSTELSVSPPSAPTKKVRKKNTTNQNHKSMN